MKDKEKKLTRAGLRDMKEVKEGGLTGGTETDPLQREEGGVHRLYRGFGRDRRWSWEKRKRERRGRSWII